MTMLYQIIFGIHRWKSVLFVFKMKQNLYLLDAGALSSGYRGLLVSLEIQRSAIRARGEERAG